MFMGQQSNAGCMKQMKKSGIFIYITALTKKAVNVLFYQKKFRQMKSYLLKHTNEVITFGPSFSKYFLLHYNEENNVFLFPEDRTQVIEREFAALIIRNRIYNALKDEMKEIK